MKKPSIAGAMRQAAQGTAAPEQTPDAPASPQFSAAPARTYRRAATREGKKMIAAPVDPAAHQQLKILAAERGVKAEALLREALRDLFTKYGRPPIA